MKHEPVNTKRNDEMTTYRCFFPQVTEALVEATSATEARAIFAARLGVPEYFIFASIAKEPAKEEAK